MRIVMTAILLFVLFACGSNPKRMDQSVFEKSSIDIIDESAEALLEDSLINSISLGVSFKGEKIARYYGELDKGLNNPPSKETIFEIASVTKTFVGTLMAQAELDGKLSLEDDVRKYIGEEYANLAYNSHPIRIKHLLTHTSELPRWLPESINDLFGNIDEDLPFRLVEIEKAYSKSKFLKDLQNVKLDSVPGTRFSYSNADTELAAYILEQIYEMSFDELLEKNICSKINMPNTKIRLDENQKKNLANGYFGGTGKVAPKMTTTLWGASGAGKSTTVDLLNYIDFQLDQNNKVVQKTHEVLYDKEVIFGDPTNKIGYFWILSSDDELGEVISHHGGANGTQNWLLLYPELDLGITIISNQGHFQTGGKLWEIVEVITSEMLKVQSED